MRMSQRAGASLRAKHAPTDTAGVQTRKSIRQALFHSPIARSVIIPRADRPASTLRITCHFELMRRSLLSNAVRRLTFAGPREAASSFGGVGGVAGSLLSPLDFSASAAYHVSARPSPAFGLTFGSTLRPFSASAFSRAGSDLHDVLQKEYKQESEQEAEARVVLAPGKGL